MSAHTAVQQTDTVSMLHNDEGKNNTEPTAPQDRIYPNIAAIRVSTWQLNKVLARNNQPVDDN